jgi:CubicO group peptidase (beta-lactamase class C family)
MVMKKFCLLLSIASVFISTILAQDESKQIDSLVTAYTNNAEFSGTVLVAKKGKILLEKGYGYSNAMQQVPNDAATVYNIASVTKTFTAALILKLQEKGKLSVKDTLGTYYPGYPQGGKITIHQLLTHTSGIHDYLAVKEFQRLDQTKALSLEEMIAFFKDKPLDFEPGSKFHYSNSGYTMLGYIIEKVTGMPYGKALQTYIFNPLHMRHTSFGPPDTTTVKLATGYMVYYKSFKRPSFRVNPSISYATGGIYSSVEDLYIWNNALQKGKFLSEKTLAQAYKKDKGNYGYGWFTDTLYGKQRVSHDGNIPGYKSNINRFPGDDICVIALSNSNNSGVGGMVRNMVNILYHQPLTTAFANLPVISIPDSVKQEYTGIYKFRKEDSVQVAIRLSDTHLFITVANQLEVEILPVFKDVFKVGTARIEFKRDNKGHVKQIWMFKDGEIAQVTKLE